MRWTDTSQPNGKIIYHFTRLMHLCNCTIQLHASLGMLDAFDRWFSFRHRTNVNEFWFLNSNNDIKIHKDHSLAFYARPLESSPSTQSIYINICRSAWQSVTGMCIDEPRGSIRILHCARAMDTHLSTKIFPLLCGKLLEMPLLYHFLFVAVGPILSHVHNRSRN